MTNTPPVDTAAHTMNTNEAQLEIQIAQRWFDGHKQLQPTEAEMIQCLIEASHSHLIESVEEYFGHILNDGVTGKPMTITVEQISKDIISLLKRKGVK